MYHWIEGSQESEGKGISIKLFAVIQARNEDALDNWQLRKVDKF